MTSLFRCFGERPISTQYCRGSCLSLDNGWVRVDPEDEKDGVIDTNNSEGQVKENADESATDLKQNTTTRNSNGRAENLVTSGSRQNCDFIFLFLTNIFLLSRF